MKYKNMGTVTKAACTPTPSTPWDNRSCREINKCKKECVPKTLKCSQCGSMNSSLSILEEFETGKRIELCYKCWETIYKQGSIVRD